MLEVRRYGYGGVYGSAANGSDDGGRYAEAAEKRWRFWRLRIGFGLEDGSDIFEGTGRTVGTGSGRYL